MTNQKARSFLTVSLLLFIILLSIFSTDGNEFSCFSSLRQKNRNGQKNWTIMLFFCADTRSAYVTSNLNNSGNGLYLDMLATLNSIQDDLTSASASDINIIALFDYPWTPNYHYGHAVMYEITKDLMDDFDYLGQTNMGDQQTLEDFINYCKTNYPADNYALTLCNHGRGYAGFCYDYHASHPYWFYALGDCLTVEEIDSALSNTGGVDILFLDTCSGGSFEVAWQLIDEVDYIIAGESLQWNNALYHSNEITYNLSRNTDYTPFELARCGFDCAKWFQVAPWNDVGCWKSVSFYDLTKFDIGGDTPSFMDTFSAFTDALIDELDYDYDDSRALFTQIRNEITVDTKLFSTKSMMVDLYLFVDKVLTYSDQFHNNNTINYLASQLLFLLTPNSEGVLIDEWSYPWYDEIYGFSICFPDTYNMYQEYLYPNFYEDLDISLQTKWDNFIRRMYPDVHFNLNELEFWEFQLNRVDPSVNLHVFLDQDPLKNPLHVGLNEFSEFGMGIELGIEGAEFFDDLLFGNSMIRIPAQSLQEIQRKNNETTFRVVVNATAAASATQQINLTAKHVKNQTVVWEENQLSSFEIGQTLSCEFSTNDEWTELELEEEPTTTPPTTSEPPTSSSPPTTTSTSTPPRTGFIGPAYALIFSTFTLSATIIVIVIHRKKKRV